MVLIFFDYYLAQEAFVVDVASMIQSVACSSLTALPLLKMAKVDVSCDKILYLVRYKCVVL